MRTELNLPHTITVKLRAAVGALAVAIALPAATAAAQDPPPSPSPGGFGYAEPTPDPASPTVFADGSTLAAPVGDLLGDVVSVHGTVAGAHPGDTVQLERLDPVNGWVAVATATVAADGSFDAAWTPAAAGPTKLRAVPASDSGAARTATTSADPDGRDFTVFRPVRATWYGPGFYGKRTACGQRLTSRLLGVAHRTLPCGTLVRLFNNGRTVTVPVVDRGPFAHGAGYDLTAATARALGVTATTRIGAVRATS